MFCRDKKVKAEEADIDKQDNELLERLKANQRQDYLQVRLMLATVYIRDGKPFLE